jgi:DNA-binding MarR family transcriptional regulator
MDTEFYFDEAPAPRMYELFRRTGAAIHRARRKELRKFKLSDSEAAVLFVVKSSNNMITPAGIAHQLIQDNHAVAQLIVRMQKRGLLKKVKDLPRPNMVRVVLTEYGELMREKTKKFKAIEEIFSILSEKEREQLTSNLERLWAKATEITG